MATNREARYYAATHGVTRMQARIALATQNRIAQPDKPPAKAFALPPQPPGTMRLDHWSAGLAFEDPYRAPETIPIVLRGHCVERPDPSGKGHRLQSSPIVASEGRVVTTHSGSRYFLGDPDPSYVAYLRGLGRSIDEEQPVKVGVRP